MTMNKKRVPNSRYPVLTIDSGKWDVRQAVVSGQRDKLVRWMVKSLKFFEILVIENKSRTKFLIYSDI